MFNQIFGEPLFQETVFIVLSILIGFGVISYSLRNRSGFELAWKIINSWLLAAPALFLLILLPGKGPLIALTVLAIFSSKIFFQMVGIYHRSWFVWACYLGIVGLYWSMTNHLDQIFDLMPMILLFSISLIPILRNSFYQMIQYISLTLLAFCLMGWALFHLGKIYYWPKGHYILIYIVILTEVSDNIFLMASRYFHRIRPWDKITQRRSLDGFIIAVLCTQSLAWGLRHLLPQSDGYLWVISGFIASMAGGLGDLFLSTIKKDLGIKDISGFLLGRGNLVDLLDRLIFVAPIYYHIMNFWLPS